LEQQLYFGSNLSPWSKHLHHPPHTYNFSCDVCAFDGVFDGDCCVCGDGYDAIQNFNAFFTAFTWFFQLYLKLFLLTCSFWKDPFSDHVPYPS